MSLGDVGVAADGIILVRHPHDQDDVERRGRVVEKLRHDGLHPCKSQEWIMMRLKMINKIK